jgi:hypothetical protein
VPGASIVGGCLGVRLTRFLPPSVGRVVVVVLAATVAIAFSCARDVKYLREGGNKTVGSAVAAHATTSSRNRSWEVPMRILFLLGLLAIAVPLTVIVADASQSSGSGAVKFGCGDCE